MSFSSSAGVNPSHRTLVHGSDSGVRAAVHGSAGRAVGAWRKEEASVAGESPDRSKQHGASAEPTSGSGAPVPGSATTDRDPRRANAGEKVRVDQATAVFSTRALRGGS